MKIDFAESKRVATGVFCAFFVCWTATQCVLNADRALHFDLFEAYAWGREFQLSYAQHGPFWAWIAGAWFTVMPRTNSAFVILEALNATAGVVGAYALLGLFASGRERWTALMLLLVTPFYTFAAYKYNANTIFIALWPWTLFFFVRSVEKLEKIDSVMFGVFAAFCVLSKYYAVLLLATCGIALLVHPNGRRFLLSPLPWIAAVVFSALIAPHAWVALRQDLGPITYAEGLTGLPWASVLSHLGRFIGDNAASLAVAIGIVAVAPRQPASVRPNLFLAVLTWGPVIMTIVAALVFRLKLDPLMAVGVFPLVGLFLARAGGVSENRFCFQAAAIVSVGIAIVSLAGSPIIAAKTAAMNNGPSYTMPFRELAAAATDLWHKRTAYPLRVVGGNRSFADGLAFYSTDAPSSFAELDFRRTPWITPSRIRAEGLLVVCVHGDANCALIARKFAPADYQPETIRIGRSIGNRRTEPVIFDVFVII